MNDYIDAVRDAAARLPDPRQRMAAYDRARNALVARLRRLNPPLPEAVIEAEREKLELAIQAVEDELAGPPPGEVPAFEALPPRPGRVSSRRLIAVMAVVAIAAALALAVSLRRGGDGAGRPATAAADAPSYVLRRQLVFYRSDHVPDTLIVDKGQRFLYVIRNPTTAVRYAFELGDPCAGTAGLLRVSRKDRPVVYLGAGPETIHGLDRPVHAAARMRGGCFGLGDSDIGELFDRVAVGGRVLVTD